MNNLINIFKRANFNKFKYYSNHLIKYKNSDWKEFDNYDESTYKKNLVYRNENFEIFIVCWKPGQGTILHDHSKNGCLLKILKGSLQERLFYKDGIIENNNLLCNDITYIDNNIGKHIMSNNSCRNSVSLHIYSPPNYIIKSN
mgnify:CR=1 FL=1